MKLGGIILIALIFISMGCVSKDSALAKPVLIEEQANSSFVEDLPVAPPEPFEEEPLFLNTSTPLPIQAFPIPSLVPTAEDPREVIVYFYSSACAVCRAIDNQTYALEAQFNSSYRWVRFDVRKPQGRPVYLDYFSRFNLSEKDRIVPIAYVRNESFIMKSAVLEDLPQYLGGKAQ